MKEKGKREKRKGKEDIGIVRWVPQCLFKPLKAHTMCRKHLHCSCRVVVAVLCSHEWVTFIGGTA